MQLLGVGAQQRAQPGVDIDDPTGPVEHRHAIGHEGHEVGEALHAAVAGGDVADDADDAHRGAVGRLLHLGPAAEQDLARQVQLDVVVGVLDAVAQRGVERVGLPPLDVGRGIDPGDAVELLQRVAAGDDTGGEVEAPGADPREALQLRRPGAVHATLRAPGLIPLDQRHDGQRVDQRPEPDDLHSHRDSVGAEQTGVTVRTGQNL